MARANFSRLCEELWNDDDVRFEAKAQDVAIALAAAVYDAGLTRAQLAERLGWKPSRVSKILTGSTNLTLRTIHQICSAIGLEFDLVLRKADEFAVAVNPGQAAVMCHEIEDNLHKSRDLLATAQSLHKRTWEQVRDTRRFTRHQELVTKVAAA